MSKTEEQNTKWRNSLRDHIQSISMPERHALAKKIGTTLGHLNGIVYGRHCNISIAVGLHKETNGKVSMEEMYPDLDWDYVRSVMATQNVSVDSESIKKYLHDAIENLPVIPLVRTDDSVLQS